LKVEDTGKEKVKKICDVLRRETLEPAEKEAKQIVQAAEEQAKKILQAAKEQADKMKKAASDEIEKEKNVFQSSLNQACKQSLQSLYESIEQRFFNEELSALLAKPLQDPKVLTNLIQAVLEALKKEGVDADLEVLVPKAIAAQDINALLLKEFVGRLKGGSVSVGPANGGIEVKVSEDNMTIDVTDVALKDLVARYIRKDFREILFRTN
jgi:V/A-type H+/Na+-transporting ATPase subunit E